MKISQDKVRELADILAELITKEISSVHKPALLLHEEEVLVFLKVKDLIERRNPIERDALRAVRKGIDAIWDNATVLTGQNMDLLARALDIAEQHDKEIVASEEHWLANAY